MKSGGLDGRLITIPRHREVNERTAHGILEGLRRGVRRSMVGVVRPTYTIMIERDQGWWAIRVAELPGVFSQARRLDRVEVMARGAISLLLEVPPDSFDIVVVRERLLPEVEQIVAEALKARAEAVERQEVASAKSREAVRALTRLGLPHRDIGRLLDMSHQRVGQLASATRPDASSRPRDRSRRRTSAEQ